MSQKVLHYEGFSISVSENWYDITETLEDDEAPLTIAEPTSGVGALQFSPAIYKGGKHPHVSLQDLSELLEEFADNHGLEPPFDCSTYPGKTSIQGASFHTGNDFLRAWYVSDGKSAIFVTYTCQWKHRLQEASEGEAVVRSIQFAT